MQKDFLEITDWTQQEILETLQLARELKAGWKRGERLNRFAGKTLAMIFQKPSTRTRVSFEVGFFQMGGHALYLGPNDIQIGKRESTGDVAQTLSRFVDMIMARMFGHDDIVELAKNASVPVVNGLTDLLHPCQIMADMLTILEQRGSFDGLKLTYIGDGNNVANSWLNMAARIPMTLALAVPPGYEPNAEVLAAARDTGSSDIQVLNDPHEASRDAHVLYTDVWASMGQEEEAVARKQIFKKYQVNHELLSVAASNCVVMHCLPAHRGEEITAEVIDGPQAIVFDQAENRMHAQKAIMAQLAA